MQLGGQRRGPGRGVADGKAPGAEVEDRRSGPEEGAHDLSLVTVRVGAATHDHEGGGVGRGVGGAGGEDAGGSHDRRAVVGVLVKVGTGGAGEDERAGALLDEATDAGDGTGVGQVGVLLEGDVAPAELDAGGIVAGKVADELVGVAEAEHRFARRTGVERDRGGVDEGVVLAAGEGKVDAVVDHDVAVEIVLAVDDVDFTGVEPRVDLDARAAAIVDHGGSQQLEGGAGGAGEVGREGAGVVLQDGEGAAVADEHLLLAQALHVRDERAALDLGVIVGRTAGQQQHEGAGPGLDDAPAGDAVDAIVAEDGTVVITVAAGLLVDGERVAVEAQRAAETRARDDELALAVDVGGGAHRIDRGVDFARGRGPDVRRTLGAQGEVRLEIADRLVVMEDDLGAGAGVGHILPRGILGQRQGADVGEEGRTIIPA